MLLNPTLGALLQRLGSGLRFEGSLSPREREVAILTVGAQTQSQFEVWAHRRVAETVGLSSDEIDGLLIGRFVTQNAREQICHDFTRHVLAGDHVSDSEFQTAHALLGDAGLFELTTVAGYYFTLAALLRVFEVGRPAMP
nr:carboxymuconolactone decarboxylase family protein [Microbacterium sp. BR1]